MKLDDLSKMVAEDAALRRRQRLQPVGGVGDKIFPPTYPGEGRNNPPPQHVFERRRVENHPEDVWCVLVDSVQSQANRLEDCLMQAIRAGQVSIPHVVVDFRNRGIAGLEEITSLEAPHRIYDAILRDSLLGNEPFMKSALGQSLAKAKPGDATAILETSPTALLFGAWHSTGEGGGLGAKFARALVSELVAVNVPVGLKEVKNSDTAYVVALGENLKTVDVTNAGRRTGSRIDPLGVLRKVEVFKGESGWSTKKDDAGKNAKQVRPSEINHGNIAPSITPLGITCDYIEHSLVISFAALRRLRFGSAEKDAAGRTLLAALGLLAVAEQDAQGYALRSRCDLVCEGRQDFEQVAADGKPTPQSLDRDIALKLYTDALAAAQKAGFVFADAPIRLIPQDKLVAIVHKSQELALSGKGGGDEGEE